MKSPSKIVQICRPECRGASPGDPQISKGKASAPANPSPAECRRADYVRRTNVLLAYHGLPPLPDDAVPLDPETFEDMDFSEDREYPLRWSKPV
jgi:hypothetical protein